MPPEDGRPALQSAFCFPANGHDFVIDGGLTANIVGWTEGLALRAELGVAIKTAAERD